MPKVELPKVELPKIELPKIELPKVELPNIELPNIELPNLELPRLPQPKPRPVRTVTRRSLLFQEGFWRPRHYRPLKEHLPWLASVLPLFLMFCFYYERPGVTWRERAGHLLRSTARFVNVALWLVLAAMALMTFRDALWRLWVLRRVHLRVWRRHSAWVLWAGFWLVVPVSCGR